MSGTGAFQEYCTESSGQPIFSYVQNNDYYGESGASANFDYGTGALYENPDFVQSPPNASTDLAVRDQSLQTSGTTWGAGGTGLPTYGTGNVSNDLILDSSGNPVANASVVVRAQPLDPSTWTGGAYPQVGSGTTNSSGYVSVSDNLSSVENSTFETDEGIISLGVYYRDSSGNYDLAGTDSEYLNGSTTNKILSQVTALNSGATPLVGASFNVVAEPNNLGLWSGGAYPVVGSGTTGTGGAFTVVLSGLASVLGDPTFESASDVLNLGVSITDALGNQYSSFQIPVYVGTDPVTASEADAAPSSVEGDVATFPGTAELSSTEQANYDDAASGTQWASPPPSNSGDCLSIWNSRQCHFCMLVEKSGGGVTVEQLGHWFIRQVPLGDLHSRDWAGTAEMRFTSDASTTVGDSLSLAVSGGGFGTPKVSETDSWTNGNGASVWLNVGNGPDALHKGNWGHAMTTGFWFIRQYYFNCANSKSRMLEWVRAEPNGWEGDTLHIGKNTKGTVKGAPGQNANSDYTIDDKYAGLYVTDVKADGAQGHIWSDVMTPGGGASKSRSQGERYEFDLGVSGLAKWGISVAGSFDSTSETEWQTSVEEDWQVEGAANTKGGCLYGTTKSPLHDAVAFGGQPFNGYCGPNGSGTNGDASDDEFQFIPQ